MPIPYDFPHELLGAPLIGKQRQTQQKYDTRRNFDGKSLKRKKRGTSTVYFEVQFLVPAAKLPLMALWLETKDQGQDFKITLQSEGGFNEYTAFWDVMPDNPSESQGYYTYSGTLYADKLLQGWEDATDAEKDEFYDFVAQGGPNSLEITVNENWPS
jgi:hypothetical protein